MYIRNKKSIFFCKHIACASLAHRLRIACASLAYRLRIACISLAHRLHINLLKLKLTVNKEGL